LNENDNKKEYDKERRTVRREWEGNCTVSKVKENRIFLHSFCSIFHIPHYLIFHSYRYFYVIWLLSSEWISAQISYKRNGVGDCMHNISPSNFIRNTPIHTSHISHFITFLYYMQFFLVHVHLYICAQFLIQYFPIMFSAIMLIFVGRRF